MTKARLDGLYMLLLGCLVFVLLGFAIENSASDPMTDFKVLYYPARCLLQHCDPYIESQVLRIYMSEGGSRPSDTKEDREVIARHIYLPSDFFFTVPFALLPWGPAHTLWISLSVGCFIFASFLIWNLGADYAPIVSGVLIGFLVGNSELLIITGNAAGIVISLCAMATWCFLRERFVPAGIVCLAIGLAVKPHDAGLVWLYFLLAGGVYRRRALQTLVVAGVLSLPGVLWVWHVAPHWMQELHSNIQTFSLHGGISDPGPASTGAHGLDMMICLQTVISVFRDDPRFYNAVSYLLSGALLLVWAVTTVRSRWSRDRAWLALASIAALTMLPVYHRQVDAKLLLLTAPACAMLWIEGGVTGHLALLVNTAGFVLTGDLPWVVVIGLLQHLHLPATRFSSQMIMGVQLFPAPLILLVVGIFYLWVYVRRCSVDKPTPAGEELQPRLDLEDDGHDHGAAAGGFLDQAL